jgi:hypothetical protein
MDEVERDARHESDEQGTPRASADERDEDDTDAYESEGPDPEVGESGVEDRPGTCGEEKSSRERYGRARRGCFGCHFSSLCCKNRRPVHREGIHTVL